MPDTNQKLGNDNTKDEAAVFLTGPEVQIRYRRSHVTIWRWMQNTDLGFPSPVEINGFKYWRLADLEAWEERNAGSAPK